MLLLLIIHLERFIKFNELTNAVDEVGSTEKYGSPTGKTGGISFMLLLLIIHLERFVKFNELMNTVDEVGSTDKYGSSVEKLSLIAAGSSSSTS